MKITRQEKAIILAYRIENPLFDFGYFANLYKKEHESIKNFRNKTINIKSKLSKSGICG